MKTSNQSNTANDKPRTVEDIIRAIQEKSADGAYIFRGESECNNKVSSNLFRELDAINAKYSDIKEVEAGIVADAKAYTDKTNDSEICYDLQHYGGKTNLIDFTTDFHIALFFACYGSPTKSGRIIILQQTEDVKKMLRYPQTPEIRVRSQKSVFAEPPKGYIEQKYEVICISRELKLPVLQHLQTTLDSEISPKTIYNDFHGFISSHNTYWRVYRDFYGGLTSQNKADKAKTLKEKRNACKEAIVYYTNALEQDLQLASIYYNRGNAYNNIDEYDLAIADFNMAIQLDSNLVETYNNRGNAYGQKGEYDRAIEDYNKAIQIKPDYANPYYGRGYAYGCKSNYKGAITDYTKVIELKPDYAEAYNNRGGIYGEKGEFDCAIEDCNRAIQIRPDYAEAYNNRGNAYSKKGEYGHAITDYNRAIHFKPDYAEAYNNRGNVYIKKGESDLAIKDCSMAIQLKSNYAEAYYNRGTAYGKKNEYDLAIKNFNTAIEIKSDYAAAYNNRGVAYYDKGDFDRAIENFNTAIEITPNYAEAYNNCRVAYHGKRMVYYEKNKSQFGVDYTEAIRKSPDDPNAYYNRGKVFLRLKLWDKARADLMTAKEMGADIVALFHNFYANIADFEHECGFELPEDIAAMLTPPQA